MAGNEAASGEERQRPLALRDRWTLIAILVITLIAQWGAIAWWASAEHKHVVENRLQVLQQLTSAMREETLRLFRSLESSLLTVDHWLAAHPDIHPHTDRAFTDMVADLRHATDGVIDIRLVSADGRLYYISSTTSRPVANVIDREYFIAAMIDPDRRLYFSEPVTDVITDMPGIPVSWRLRREIDGIAVITANIDLKRLLALHELERMKPSGTIAIVREDGVMLSRVPYDPQALGKSIAGTVQFQHHLSQHDSGTFISKVGVADGASRLVSFAKVGPYPLMVTVTVGMKDAFEELQHSQDVVIVLGALLSLALVTLTTGLFITLGRARKAENELAILATTDGLTGLYNHHRFFQLAEREFARVRRYGRPLAILALDIDHFKLVNDTYGHAAGDAVLQAFAHAWRETLRGSDSLGRVGGEEFCALLPETALEAACRLADRLRIRTSEIRIPHPRGDLQATVSIGVTMVAVTDSQVRDTIGRADAALYRAKAQGRNRVVRG